MKPECWTAVRGASGRDFAIWAGFWQNLAQTSPVVRSQLGRGGGPGRPDG